MSRTLFLDIEEGQAIARCLKEHVGVSAVERLPTGGIRLVCMSSAGAERLRKVLKSHLICGDVSRERYRPRTPLW